MNKNAHVILRHCLVGIAGLLCICIWTAAAQTTRLKAISKHKVKVPEPSDICYSPVTNTYFVVSDKGWLYETDTNFQIIRKANTEGYDFEGVYADSAHVYVSDETMRRVFILDLFTLEKVSVKMVQYHGGRNLGYESITWNAAKKCFVMATEKDPTRINDFDQNFILQNETNFKRKGDISSVTFYNGYLYALSDERHTVYRLHPLKYTVEATYPLQGIINPEGICFDKSGNLLVLSDDLQLIYKYQIPQ